MSEMEYGMEATGDVPSPAFVDRATPMEAMKSPMRNMMYCLIVCFNKCTLFSLYHFLLYHDKKGCEMSKIVSKRLSYAGTYL